jgi:hypothetical protein
MRRERKLASIVAVEEKYGQPFLDVLRERFCHEVDGRLALTKAPDQIAPELGMHMGTLYRCLDRLGVQKPQPATVHFVEFPV